MKTSKFFIFSIVLPAVFFLNSCELDNEPKPSTDTGILPERFAIEIPSSLSNVGGAEGFKSATDTQGDTLNGNAIYRHLNFFIRVGDEAAHIVQDIIRAIAYYGIDEAMRLSYQSEEDGRVKNLVVEENVEYNGTTWEFMLTITDVESEGEPDGGKGLQIFWNRSPIAGIAILKPYNIDRSHNRLAHHAMFRIEYSEVPTDRYDGYMIVEIAGLPLGEDAYNDGKMRNHRHGQPDFALRNMKMFVGKEDSRIDVFGNSDHPNARFYNDRSGFSWSFVGSGLESEDIAVAEVGLPPNLLDEDDRNILLKEYSIKNVLTAEITEWFLETWGIGPDSTDLANYLYNAEAPGYFAAHRFVQAGTSPGSAYDPLEAAIEELAPYNPKSVHELVIRFK